MKYLKLIIFAGFAIRLLYAARIGFQGAADGLDMDAESFYLHMVNIARTGIYEPMRIGEPLLVNTIGALMGLFGDGVFVGCLFSCLAWLVSGLFFSKSVALTDANDSLKMMAVTLYSFWPTGIPYTTITLREPYQLMFVSIALYAALALFRGRNAFYWPVLAFGLIGTGALHGGLAAFGIAMFILTMIFYSLFGGSKFPLAQVLFAAVLAFIIGYFGFLNSGSLGYNIEGGLIESAQSYQGGGLGNYGRTNYKEEVASITGLDALFFVPIGLFQYLFEPMPWKISTSSDIVLFVENLTRLAIILLAIVELVKSPKHPQRTLLFFLISAYFAQEMLWSLGTVNWGTASRHHVPAMGLLILTGLQALFLRNHRLMAPRQITSAARAA